MTDPYDQHMSAGRGGMYESHYLKANSPCGGRAFWLKHTLFQPIEGQSCVEFWAVWFERGRAPVVAKIELDLEQVHLSAVGMGLEAPGQIRLAPHVAEGGIADLSWTLAMSGGLAPLHHFRHPWMYRAALPKKKLCTPAPNLRFNGQFRLGGRRVEIQDWIGIRGHNWGTEHAWRYAYGNCNIWSDGAQRCVDGFSAQLRLAGRRTPWLSSVVGFSPHVRQNRLRRLRLPCSVTSESWSVGWGAGSLEMTGSEWVGLRYRHPDGSESYCYNTKFAKVHLQTHGQEVSGQLGELELMRPEPTSGIELHPAAGWDATDGAYRSDGTG